MPKYTKQFVVFNGDVSMYVYIPEDDDHSLSTGRATLHDFKEAKALIIKNLEKQYKRNLADIEAITYKDFK